MQINQRLGLAHEQVPESLSYKDLNNEVFCGSAIYRKLLDGSGAHL